MTEGNQTLAEFIRESVAGPEKAELIDEIIVILSAMDVAPPDNLKQALDGLVLLSKFEVAYAGRPGKTRAAEARGIADALRSLKNRIVALFGDERDHLDLIWMCFDLPGFADDRKRFRQGLCDGSLIDPLVNALDMYSRFEPHGLSLKRAQFNFASSLWREFTKTEPALQTSLDGPYGAYLDFMRAALRYGGWSDDSTKFENLKDRFYDYRKLAAE